MVLMSAYRLVERNLFTDQPIRSWDTTDGHSLTAGQAGELLIKVAATRPELHASGAETYLEVESVYAKRRLSNPMWNELGPHVTAGRWPGMGGARQLDFDRARDRFTYCSKYSWTVTSPDTVAFVAEHLGAYAVDPLAGSGYWAFLLAQLGVDVITHDVKPPNLDREHNHYHYDGQHVAVHQVDAVETIAYASNRRGLLLSWPPYSDRIGADLVDLYRGDRIVYIGEMEGGCCGNDRMFRLLDRGWDLVAEHEPVQWFGMHDYVTVYDRRARALPSPVLEGEIVTPTPALPVGGAS